MQRWIKRVITLCVIVIVAVGGYFGYKRFSKPAAANTQQSFYRVTAQKGKIDVSVAASGSVSSSVNQDITLDGNGTISELNISEGQQVKKGDVIATLSDDTIQQNIDKLENNLQQQNISLSKLKDSLNDLYIKAPASGRIKSVKAKVGEDCGTTTRTYGALAVISTDGKMKVSFKPENGPAVQDGEKVTVTPNGGSPVEGVVSENSISTSQQGNQGDQSSQNIGGAVTVIINRDDYTIGTQVTVAQSDGTVIGKGDLEVNNAVSVTGNNGVISVIYVSENSKVTRGKNLFKLKDTDVKSNIDSQNLNISQTKKDLTDAKAQLDDLDLKAPVDGIVTALSAKAGDSVQGNKVIATIVDPAQLQVVAAVDELDISKVKIGQKATITLEALPDKTFDGTVEKIADIGQSTNNVTTYDVTINILNPTGIKIGMSANAQIHVASKDNVLLLPIEAIQDRNGQKFVMLASGTTSSENNNQRSTQAGQQNGQRQGNQQSSSGQGSNQRTGMGSNYGGNGRFTRGTGGSMRQIEVGLMNENYAEIISGLKEGDQVAVAIQASSSTSTNQNTRRVMGGFGSFGGGGGFAGAARGGRD